MEDTPEHVKKIQLELWLAKTPGERILQYLKDNEELYKMWDAVKAQQQQKGDEKEAEGEWPGKEQEHAICLPATQS